ncbi:MAG: hypothetical protein BGN97_13875 [Microbacterium sp. 69-10]|nr:MAG: hypothetical protein BGN97_13875 [Microbacterium sp. 69-10]
MPSPPSIFRVCWSVAERSRNCGIDESTFTTPTPSITAVISTWARLAGRAPGATGAADCCGTGGAGAGADAVGICSTGGRPARARCSSGVAYSPYCGRSTLMASTLPPGPWAGM